MSALDALRTSMSGMNAQSTKLAGISNNIANSSTVGYKRVSTQFESLVLEGSGSGSYAMAGTRAHNRVAISQVGQVQRTNVDTDIAVNGNGFIVVNDQATSNGKYLATRAGSFRTDEFGNLVNSAGYYLQGAKLNADGTAAGNKGDNNVDSLETVNLNTVGASAAATTEITFWANLPPDMTGYTGATPDPVESTVDYYDPLGKAQTLTFSFQPSATKNNWTLSIYDSASPAATPPVPISTLDLEFNPNGANAGTIKAVTNVTGTGAVYSNTTGKLTVTTGGGPEINLNIGVPNSSAGMSQLDGDFVATRIEKDGSAFGLLQRVTIEEDGKVMATFSNGQSRAIYQLKLAMFANPDGLNPVRGDAYEMARDAGAIRLLNPGTGAAGATSGGALEASTVDIGTELTALIETQRAYSSNASVIRTADQMLQEATDLKR